MHVQYFELFVDKRIGYIKDKIRNEKKMAIRKFGNLLPLIKLGYGSIGERNLFIYGPVSKLTASLSQKFNLLFCLKISV